MRKFGSVAAAVGFSVALLLSSRPSSAFDVDVSISVAPPELPVYEQPDIPGDGYIWTPGYWAWGDGDYYWVPGTWVLAPQPGYLWTPGYWGWDSGFYRWHGGYWGTQIGFYGGVNYGYGYFGHGYDGGYWDRGAFRYNRAYNNVHDTHITNVYNKTVVNNITVNRVSFNGGNGGIDARADQRELAAEQQHHMAPVAAQMRHEQVAQSNPDLRVSSNHGHPAIAATPRAGEFSGRGVIAAHDAAPLTHAPQHDNMNAPTRPTMQQPVPETPRETFRPPQQMEQRAPAAPTHEFTPQRPVTPQVQQHVPEMPRETFRPPQQMEQRAPAAPMHEFTPQRPVAPQMQQRVPEMPRETFRPPQQVEQRAPAAPPPQQQHEQHAPAQQPAAHAERREEQREH